MTSSVGLRVATATLLAGLFAGCGKVQSDDPVEVVADAAVDAMPVVDAAPPADASTLGSERDPAPSCAELLKVQGPVSGVYWVKHPDGHSAAFQVYCDQQLNQGGWALVYNSVRREDGKTTAFWNIPKIDRFKTKGIAAADENYYQGSLYLIGAQYMDVIVDLAGKSLVAAVVQTGGIDPDTMRFKTPLLTSGDARIFQQHFASGWSSPDSDGDTFAGDATLDPNCAIAYGSVTQHYGACWTYSLGADADAPFLDGGVGPHMNNVALTDLGLSPQEPADGSHKYSQVRRIARFTRW